MTSLARYLDPQVIQQVSRLDLRARFIVEGFLSGLHRSPFHGYSIEFSEHRKYVAGDDPRTIDWNVFGRTDRLFVRKFQAETHLACHLLVDVSASMGYVGSLGTMQRPPRRRRYQRIPPIPQPAGKLLYAIHLAAALGYLLTRQQDAVGLGVIGNGLEQWVPPRARQSHLVQLLATLSAIVPRGTTRLIEGLHAAWAQIPHRGVVVVLSDLLTETDGVLDALLQARFRGHDLIVMHILDEAEVRFPFTGSVRLEDPETGHALHVDAESVRTRYARAVADWRRQLHERIDGARGDYVPLHTAMPFDKALVEFLMQRSKRR